MMPQRKKPNILTDLRVDELSLVTEPACAWTDPVTGRKTPLARVAIWKMDDSGDTAADRLARLRKLTRAELFEEVKRMQGKKKDKKRREAKDDPGTQDIDAEDDGELRLPLPKLQPNQAKSNKESKVPKLRKILKGETVASRSLIEGAVIAKATKIAKRKNISPEAAEAEVWSQPGVTEAYEAVPKPRQPQRAEPKMFQSTKAEAELDRRARLRMKRDNKYTYAKAVESELAEDPGLYDQYEKELAAGTTYLAPEQFLSTQGDDYDRMIGKRGKAKSDSPESCPECGEGVDENDSYCSSCGADLEGLDKKRKARAS
jgi:hypothetical protein